MRRAVLRAGARALAGAALAGCAAGPPAGAAAAPVPMEVSGVFPAPIPPAAGAPQIAFALRHLELAAGTGAVAGPRQCYFAHYTGWLTDGTKFDSSRDTLPSGAPRTPIAFAQGARRVIAGWDAGFEGMQVGGRRRLIIPWQLAYGELGRPPVIPPRAMLVFDVELMAVTDTLPRSGAPGPAGPQCPSWAEVSAPPR